MTFAAPSLLECEISPEGPEGGLGGKALAMAAGNFAVNLS